MYRKSFKKKTKPTYLWAIFLCNFTPSCGCCRLKYVAIVRFESRVIQVISFSFHFTSKPVSKSTFQSLFDALVSSYWTSWFIQKKQFQVQNYWHLKRNACVTFIRNLKDSSWHFILYNSTSSWNIIPASTQFVGWLQRMNSYALLQQQNNFNSVHTRNCEAGKQFCERYLLGIWMTCFMLSRCSTELISDWLLTHPDRLSTTRFCSSASECVGKCPRVHPLTLGQSWIIKVIQTDIKLCICKLIIHEFSGKKISLTNK